MKKTLLEIVQDILSDMDGDNVNSIFDTVESTQVAQIVRSTYEAMMTNREWPHLRKMVGLTSSGDPALPTHMLLPADCKRLISLNYNKAKVGELRKKYEPIKYVDPDSFLIASNQENSTLPEVDVIVDPSGIELLIRNDRPPTRYTSFDDNTVVFNSYDSSVDATLQESKVQARGEVYASWTHQDSFIPDLPAEAFPALIEEAKSKASMKVRQVQDVKAEQEAGRQQRWLSRKGWRVAGGIRYPDYGRNSRKGYRDPTFNKDN